MVAPGPTKAGGCCQYVGWAAGRSGCWVLSPAGYHSGCQRWYLSNKNLKKKNIIEKKKYSNRFAKDPRVINSLIAGPLSKTNRLNLTLLGYGIPPFLLFISRI